MTAQLFYRGGKRVRGSYYEKLPQGWALTTLGELGTMSIGLTYAPESVSLNGGTPVLRSSNVKNGKIVYDDIIAVDMEIPQKLYVQPGDILICARNGSRALVGKSAIIESGGMSFGAFMAIYRSACNSYVQVFISSEAFRGQLGSVNTTTINQITQEMLKQTVIPLPPLAEQERIVAFIETAFSQLDKIAECLN